VGTYPPRLQPIKKYMAKFECKVCGKTLELSTHTMQVVDCKVVAKEAMCCEVYMDSVKENKGFGSAIKRPGGKVRGKI
jgi:hypothetical protein|tara:strand:+ start:923 stop:1156 length:234 start_codon:yes stop_codon:yes gene_type:complete